MVIRPYQVNNLFVLKLFCEFTMTGLLAISTKKQHQKVRGNVYMGLWRRMPWRTFLIYFRGIIVEPAGEKTNVFCITLCNKGTYDKVLQAELFYAALFSSDFVAVLI